MARTRPLTPHALELRRLTTSLLTSRGINVDAILAAAARRFNISVCALRSERRHKRPSQARWVAMLALNLRGCSTVAIGYLFNRDHSTVSHGLACAAADPALATAAQACGWTWNELATGRAVPLRRRKVG